MNQQGADDQTGSRRAREVPPGPEPESPASQTGDQPSLRSAQPPPVSPPPVSARKTTDKRRETSFRAVASQLSLGNRRVETQSDYKAVIVFGQPVNHVLHAIITIFSCGLWGVVWCAGTLRK
jgi:hypothetical protein